jgi:hypothetical protein
MKPLCRAIMLGVLGLSFFSGCATLFSKKSDSIKIETDPAGAEVSIEGRKLGITPLTIDVERDTFRQKYLTIKKKGYETKRIFLEKTIDRTAFFNLGFITTTFGATSWGIDALSGAMFEYSPGYYSIDLESSEKTTRIKRSPEETGRWIERQRLVVASFENLKNDIVSGGGEWLTAYVALRVEGVKTSSKSLMNSIQKHSARLLEAKTPAQLFKRLENLSV